MTDDAAAERAAIRERFYAQRARVAAVPAQEWAERRDHEADTVRKAAARRRNAA